MKSNFLRCLALGFLLAFSSPMQGQSLLGHVPQDAFLLLNLHPDNLNRKVPLKELAALDLVQTLLDELIGKTNNLRLALDDPAAYGINLRSSSHLFVNHTPEDIGGGFLLSLSDVERFEQFLLEQFEEGYQPQELNPGRYLPLGGEFALAWTERFALLAFLQRKPGAPQLDEALRHARFRNWVQELLRLPPEKSLLARPHFREVIEGNFDAQVWMDYEKLYAFLLQAQGSLPLPSDSGMLDGEALNEILVRMNRSRQQAVGITALDGKIEVVTNQHLAPTMAAIIRAANDAKFPRRFQRYIPGDDLLGYLAFSLNLRGMGEALKPLLTDLLAEFSPLGEKARPIVALADIFLNEEALYDLFSGQLYLGVGGRVTTQKAITLTDYDEEFNPIEKDTVVETHVPGITLLSAYGDPQLLEALFDLGVDWGVLQPRGRFFTLNIPELDMQLFLAAHKGVLVLTNDRNFVERHLERGLPRKQRLNKKHIRNLKEKSSVLYVDLEQLIETILQSESGKALQALGPSELWNFPLQKIQYSAERQVEPTSRAVWELNFRHGDQNALKQFLEYLNRLFLEFGGGGQKT